MKKKFSVPLQTINKSNFFILEQTLLFCVQVLMSFVEFKQLYILVQTNLQTDYISVSINTLFNIFN